MATNQTQWDDKTDRKIMNHIPTIVYGHGAATVVEFYEIIDALNDFAVDLESFIERAGEDGGVLIRDADEDAILIRATALTRCVGWLADDLTSCLGYARDNELDIDTVKNLHPQPLREHVGGPRIGRRTGLDDALIAHMAAAIGYLEDCGRYSTLMDGDNRRLAEYTQEWYEDILDPHDGVKFASEPFNHIDWFAASKHLLADWEKVDIAGTPMVVRFDD